MRSSLQAFQSLQWWRVYFSDLEWVLFNSVTVGNQSFRQACLCLVWFLRQLQGFLSASYLLLNIKTAIVIWRKIFVSVRLWHFEVFRVNTVSDMLIIHNNQKVENKDCYSAIFRTLKWMVYRLWLFILSFTEVTAVFWLISM